MAIEEHRTYSPPPRRRADNNKGQRPDGKGGKGGKGGKDDRNQLRGIRQAFTDGRGRKICSAFNTKRGCARTEQECPKKMRHVCNFIGRNGNCEGPAAGL